MPESHVVALTREWAAARVGNLQYALPPPSPFTYAGGQPATDTAMDPPQQAPREPVRALATHCYRR